MLFGVGYYLIALFPVLGFFDIYYHRFSLVADHFQYLPIIGMIALAVHGVTCGLARLGLAGADPVTGRTRFGGRELGIVVVLVFWFLASGRSKAFENIPTLCRNTLARNPQAWIAHFKWGLYLAQRRSEGTAHLEAAVEHFDKALELKSDEVKVLHNLGATLVALQRQEEGLRYVRRAVAIDPENAVLRLSFAALLEKSNKRDEAILEYRRVLRDVPDSPGVRITLARALIRGGRTEEGIQELQEAVYRHPELADVHLALGSMLFQTGRRDEAVKHVREALRLNPSDPRAAGALQAMQRQQQPPGDVPP